MGLNLSDGFPRVQVEADLLARRGRVAEFRGARELGDERIERLELERGLPTDLDLEGHLVAQLLLGDGGAHLGGEPVFGLRAEDRRVEPLAAVEARLRDSAPPPPSAFERMGSASARHLRKKRVLSPAARSPHPRTPVATTRRGYGR